LDLPRTFSADISGRGGDSYTSRTLAVHTHADLEAWLHDDDMLLLNHARGLRMVEIFKEKMDAPRSC
jgi:hypothetical protein